MFSLIQLSFVNIFAAFTLSELSVFKPLRIWVKSKNKWAGELISCGYCSGTHIAWILTAITGERIYPQFNPFLNFVFTWFTLAWFSACQWMIGLALFKLRAYISELTDEKIRNKNLIQL